MRLLTAGRGLLCFLYLERDLSWAPRRIRSLTIWLLISFGFGRHDRDRHQPQTRPFSS